MTIYSRKQFFTPMDSPSFKHNDSSLVDTAHLLPLILSVVNLLFALQDDVEDRFPLDYNPQVFFFLTLHKKSLCT